MAEFIELLKKYHNMQSQISQTIDKYNKDSFSTRFQISQNALIQIRVFKQAIKFMGKIISDMDIELEQIDNKTK